MLIFFTFFFFGIEHDRNERCRQLALAAVLDVEKADDGKRDRTDAVDLQVLHRVNQANIQIAAKLLRPISPLTMTDSICTCTGTFRPSGLSDTELTSCTT